MVSGGKKHTNATQIAIFDAVQQPVLGLNYDNIKKTKSDRSVITKINTTMFFLKCIISVELSPNVLQSLRYLKLGNRKLQAAPRAS